MAKGEENAIVCWHCMRINKCTPLNRPTDACPNFVTQSRITQQRISELLGLPLDRVKYLIRLHGAKKVAKGLRKRGFLIYCTTGGKHNRFYCLKKGVQNDNQPIC